LKILQQIATGLPTCSVDQHDVCKGCTLGKYARLPFRAEVREPTNGILELVYSDICETFLFFVSYETGIMLISLMIILRKLGYFL